MFSTTARSTRRVRILSAAIAAGGLIAAFGLTATSASALPVPPGPPSIISDPVISGYTTVGNNAVENNTITASTGTWNDSDPTTLTFTYKWFNGNDTLVSDSSDDPTYQIQSSDIGVSLYVEVTAHDSNLNSTADDSDQSSNVIATGISNTTLPTLSGATVPGGAVTVSNGGTWAAVGQVGPITPTYTYFWSFAHPGFDAGDEDPVDTGITHTIRPSDFSYNLIAFVTAHFGGEQATVRVTTDGAVTPVAPFATDAGLTAGNEGVVTGTQTKTDATVVLPSPPIQNVVVPDPATNTGDLVYVYGYSTPTALGFFTVSASHTITVPLGGLPKGLHKLAIIDSNGTFLGWLSVTAGGGLASTGVNVNAPLELGGAGVLVLLGLLSVIFVTRSRRKAESL
jgi:hypothetical protein